MGAKTWNGRRTCMITQAGDEAKGKRRGIMRLFAYLCFVPLWARGIAEFLVGNAFFTKAAGGASYEQSCSPKRTPKRFELLPPSGVRPSSPFAP